MSDGKGWHVFRAKGKIFQLDEILDRHSRNMIERTYRPASEDYPFIPWPIRIWRYLGYCLANKTNDSIRVIVNLLQGQSGGGRMGSRLRTLISSSTQTSSRPGDARYSRRSFNLGIGTWGAFSVRRGLISFQLREIILSSLPKHLLRVAS